MAQVAESWRLVAAPKPSARRYLMLALFCLNSFANGFQWIYLSALSEPLRLYYRTSRMAINWTSMVYMLAYIPLTPPACWLFGKLGLRPTVLVGSLGTGLGAAVKCASVGRDSFAILMLGQSLVAVSQLFLLSIPPQLAAVWFPDQQVGLANAVGVLGNQLGIAIGFIAPFWFVRHDASDMAELQVGLQRLYYAVGLVSLGCALLTWLAFREAPKYPPGVARKRQIEEEQSRRLQIALTKSQAGDGDTQTATPTDDASRSQSQSRDQNGFGSLLSSYATDLSFVSLAVSYGLNVGVFYAFCTLIGLMIAGSVIGKAGVVMNIGGMLGTLGSGLLIDKTRSYKRVAIFTYSMTLILLVAFELVAYQESIALYATIFFLGYFMSGYILVGYEVANEITWPKPESISAGLLNMSAQVS